MDVGEGVSVGVGEVDIPFELVGEVASAGTVAEAGHVKGGAAARHYRVAKDVLLEVIITIETDAAVSRVCWEEKNRWKMVDDGVTLIAFEVVRYGHECSVGTENLAALLT